MTEDMRLLVGVMNLLNLPMRSDDLYRTWVLLQDRQCQHEGRYRNPPRAFKQALRKADLEGLIRVERPAHAAETWVVHPV